MPNYLKHCGQSLVALAFVFCANSSMAGGGGLTGGATEITQLLNNSELAMQFGEAVKTNMELYNQTTMQIKQLWHDVENMKRLGESFGIANINALKREIEALTNVKSLSKKMVGDLDQFVKELSTRQVEAMKSGMSIFQYVRQQQALIDSNN